MVRYATHAGGDAPVEDVPGVLLVESNPSLRFPADSPSGYAESQGLDETDTRQALYAAARESGGIRFEGSEDRGAGS